MEEYEFGPWYGKSSQAIREAYKEHTKANKRPEAFLGVRPAVKPPSNVSFEIIYDDVALGVGQQEPRIPCNLCGTQNKFCGHGLLIKDEFGCVYLGGADCGRRHFGANAFNAAVALYDKKKRETLASNFLLDAANEAGAWTSVARALVPFAEQADIAIGVLSKQQTIFRRLKQIFEKEGGQLIVYRTEARRQANGKTITTETPINIGILSGTEALSSAKPRLAEKLDIALKLLEPIGEDGDEFLRTMAEEERAGKIVRMANIYRREVASVRRVHAKLQQIQSFFSESNFEQIRRFGTHDLAPTRFGVEITKNTRRLVPAVQRANSTRIRVDRIMSGLPKLPESLGGEYAQEVRQQVGLIAPTA
ncbi:MAG TPA: hypothetical protein PLV61_09055 [Parvularculaceae bacterium]|nr:hypothetical protein [Parvularculaceae bacterium]HRX39357.1 hypothetical protein [Parvularculaceae bacterium]